MIKKALYLITITLSLNLTAMESVETETATSVNFSTPEILTGILNSNPFQKIKRFITTESFFEKYLNKKLSWLFKDNSEISKELPNEIFNDNNLIEIIYFALYGAQTPGEVIDTFNNLKLVNKNFKKILHNRNLILLPAEKILGPNHSIFNSSKIINQKNDIIIPIILAIIFQELDNENIVIDGEALKKIYPDLENYLRIVSKHFFLVKDLNNPNSKPVFAQAIEKNNHKLITFLTHFMDNYSNLKSYSHYDLESVNNALDESYGLVHRSSRIDLELKLKYLRNQLCSLGIKNIDSLLNYGVWLYINFKSLDFILGASFLNLKCELKGSSGIGIKVLLLSLGSMVAIQTTLMLEAGRLATDNLESYITQPILNNIQNFRQIPNKYYLRMRESLLMDKTLLLYMIYSIATNKKS